MSKRKEQHVIRRLQVGLASLLCAGALASCTTNTSPFTVIPGPTSFQMSVGTLNDSAGTINGLVKGSAGAGIHLNVVATFRGQFGASAFINPGSATLTGPAAGLPQVEGGIFSYGQAPNTNGVLGMPPTYTPPSSVGGYATGFIFTGVPATSGGYQLSTKVQNNGSVQTHTSSATLPASDTGLPNEAAPVYASGGASGGGTFTVTVPAGVTETLVVVFAVGGGEVASVETMNTTAILPPGTLAPGTSYTAFSIGANYPLVESGPPANTSMTPTIKNGGGTADLTVSASAGFVQ